MGEVKFILLTILSSYVLIRMSINSMINETFQYTKTEKTLEYGIKMVKKETDENKKY